MVCGWSKLTSKFNLHSARTCLDATYYTGHVEQTGKYQLYKIVNNIKSEGTVFSIILHNVLYVAFSTVLNPPKLAVLLWTSEAKLALSHQTFTSSLVIKILVSALDVGQLNWSHREFSHLQKSTNATTFLEDKQIC